MSRLAVLLLVAVVSCELAAPAPKPAKEGEACTLSDGCSSGRCSGGFCAGPDCTCDRGLQGCGTEPRTVAGCRSGWRCVGTPVTLFATGTCKLPCSAGCPASWTCKSDFCIYIPPAPTPPTVTIESAPPDELEVGVDAGFKGSATSPNGAITAFSWELGDGETAIGTEVSHAYSGPGFYTYVAKAADETGIEGSRSGSLRVCLPLDSECYPFDQRGNCCTGKRCALKGDAGTRCQN